MPGEVEAAKAAAEAAKNIIETEPVLGSLLIIALCAIAVLGWYIRSTHNSYSAQIAAINEKRVEEIKAVTSTMADATAVLGKFSDTVLGLGRTLDGIGTATRDAASKQEAITILVREALTRIEGDIGALSDKVDRQTTRGRA